MNSDYLKGRADVKKAKETAEDTYEKTASYTQGAFEKTKEMAGNAKDKVAETASNVWEKTKEKAGEAKDYTKGAFDETKK